MAAGLLIAGCSTANNGPLGVYVLLDSTAKHAGNARQAIAHLLQTLQPADILAAAHIGTESFSRKDIIARVQFDQRPSVAAVQKRTFRERFERFDQRTDEIRFADIYGGMLEAIEYLNQSGPDRKAVVIISSLREKPANGTGRGFPLQMAGFTVVSLQAEALPPDSREMRQYRQRLENLRIKVEGGSGRFHVVGDLHQLDEILKNAPQGTRP